MAKQGGRDSLNHLIWVLQESLDVLRPIQDKCEAPVPLCWALNEAAVEKPQDYFF